jgi:hypothetical protein
MNSVLYEVAKFKQQYPKPIYEVAKFVVAEIPQENL